MKFIFIRHTTTDWNSLGLIQGQTDIPLGEQGKAEAQELAQKLGNLGITYIVTSPLKRAYETAEIVKNMLNVPISIESDLRECSFGTIEGLTKQQAIDIHGEPIIPHWEDQHHAYDFRNLGGEHRDGVLDRHVRVIKSLANKSPDEIVLVVGHGRGLCTLLAEIGETPNLKRGEYRVVEYK